MQIRNANISDVPELARFAEAAFRDAFAKDNSKEDMDAYCRSSFSESIQRKEVSDPQVITLVAVENESIIGFAQWVKDSKNKSVASKKTCELKRLYVDAQWHGKGIAQGLIESVIQQSKELEFDILWLGVWENNPKAIRFYEKYGFIKVGEHDFMLGSDRQTDWIMQLKLYAFKKELKYLI